MLLRLLWQPCNASHEGSLQDVRGRRYTERGVAPAQGLLRLWQNPMLSPRRPRGFAFAIPCCRSCCCRRRCPSLPCLAGAFPHLQGNVGYLLAGAAGQAAAAAAAVPFHQIINNDAPICIAQKVDAGTHPAHSRRWG